MTLYKQWNDTVIEYVKEKGQEAFWAEYSLVEKKVYSKVLSHHEKNIKGSYSDLTIEYGVNTIFFMGFLDGINESLTNELDLENVEADTELDVQINFAKLYFNMLDAKADYLYQLPQWDKIFSKEKRTEITKSWRESKIIINEVKIGRNDPCTCGSGKKYKKCCGAAK